MKLRSLAGLAAGLLSASLLAAPAAVAAPATVTVRAEGHSATVLPRTTVTTTTAVVNKDGQAGHDCTGTSAAGALERATGGNWGASQWFDGAGYFVNRILGESADPSSTYWSFWLNYRPSDVGVCGVELQPGDDVLLFVDCFAGCAPRTPLRLSRVPATVGPNATATVVVETFQGATPVPAPGATVEAGGRRFTTAADGTAGITFEGSGPVTVRATKADHVPSAAERTCVTTGSDGACGTSVPQPSAPDTTAPNARLLGIRDGQRFTRRRAPRELRGTATADPSGLWAVKIRLTRRYKGTCWYFSGTRERFLERTCGKKHAFKVGEATDWSYLLPARLKRGRYVLDVYAVDRAFNRGATSRVVFHVR
jgi:hypothetical protein